MIYLQGKPQGLRCFGAARQIPQRLYTLDELKLNGIETVSLLSPVDATLGSIERAIQAVVLLGGIGAWKFLELSPQQLFFSSLGVLFLWSFDAKEGSLNVQAGTAFVDSFLTLQVSKGKVSATLDNLLESLGFTQKKTDAQVRCAVLNTVLILRRLEKARAVLANAMSEGRSVGSCIDRYYRRCPVVEPTILSVLQL